MGRGGTSEIPVRAPRWLGALSACFLLAAPGAEAGEVVIPLAGGLFTVPTTSLRERLFESVVKQQYDFSCGSAAIATLLTFHYDRPTEEEGVFQTMWKAGDQQKIKKVGFSLLDMQGYLTTLGFRSDGFRISLEQLQEAGLPAITMINTYGYNHFVVVKGVDDREVVIGDPASGLRIVERKTFEKSWNGIFFVIRTDTALARNHFNEDKNFKIRPQPPEGDQLPRESLSSFTVNLPGRNEF